jgi:uncharacterized protein with HEPN domain
MKPTNAAYIRHIRDAIKEIQKYHTAHEYDQFLRTAWDQAAVIRNLEIIGEAASHVTVDFQAAHPNIPWRRIADFRNVLIHEYFAVDVRLVWEILEKDLPALKKNIESLLKRTAT